MELRQYFLVVWRRWWLIALTTLVASVVAFVLGSTAAPIYRATAVLEVDRGGDPEDNPYSMQLGAETIAEEYARQVASSTVLEEVVARLELPLDPGEVAGWLSVSQVPESSMIQITVQHTDPALTQAVAQTTAEIFIAQKTAQQQSRYQASLDELEAQVADVEAELQATRIQIAALGDPDTLSPLETAELARLETQLNNNQIRLSTLLRSTEDFRLAMARYSNYISVFSRAELPRSPAGPQVLRNTALAAVVGGMVGVGVAFLLDYLDDTLHNPEEAQAALGMAALASIPELKDMEPRALVTRLQPLHPVSEAFRNLRTSVQFANLDRSVRTLLITSPTPEEGKSFVAANLAVAMAQGGKNVVLVDTDMRHPTVHRIMDITRDLGLSNLLYTVSEEGNSFDRFLGVKAFFQPAGDDLPSLSILTSGKGVPNPAEVLSSQLFHDLITWLRSRYDFVVIDSPPILAVTDAAVTATQVDGVALVINAGQTRIGAASQALERLTAVGARMLGVIMNRISADRGGYYYYYYHHYPYGQDPSGTTARQRLQRLLPGEKRQEAPAPVAAEEPNA